MAAEIIKFQKTHEAEAFLKVMDDQIRKGLGLIESSDDELPMFEFVQRIYDEANDGCFFCDSRIDPNDPPKEIKLCVMCQYKMAVLESM